MDKKSKKILYTVMFTVFVDMLGVGILIPVLPLLVSVGSPYSVLPAGWTIKQGVILLGWLSAIYPLFQFMATPILGQLSDKYGRKKVLAGSLFGTALGYTLFAFGILTKNLPLMFFARALDGITGGNISAAQAAVADISKPEERAKNFGMVGMMFGIGFVAGPYIGGKLALASAPISIFGKHIIDTPSWFGTSTPFWFAAILSGLNILFVLGYLAETNLKLNKAKLNFTKALENIKNAFKYEGIKSIAPSMLLFTGGFTFFTTFFGLILNQKFGFNQSNIGDYFAYIGICIAIAQGLIVPRVAAKFKDYKIISVAYFGTSIAILLYAMATKSNQLYIIAPILAIFNGLTMANTNAFISRTSPKQIQGEALGISASVQALGQAVPAIIAGYVGSLSQNLPIFVSAGLMMLATLVFAGMYRKK